jgi:hypothetical protein
MGAIAMPIRTLLVAFALALFSAPVFAADAPPPPQPLMGTVVSLNGDTLVIKQADGKETSVTLSPKAGISRTKIGKVSDVKSGQFIGCTAVEGPDGKLRAQEVHIFPESMRGTGEGHYPWGNQAKTTMTNGDVKQMEGVADGNVIKVTYKGGETTISIPPSTRVTIIEAATRADLKPGTNVTVFMGKDESGKPVAMGVGIAPNS